MGGIKLHLLDPGLLLSHPFGQVLQEEGLPVSLLNVSALQYLQDFLQKQKILRLNAQSGFHIIRPKFLKLKVEIWEEECVQIL